MGSENATQDTYYIYPFFKKDACIFSTKKAVLSTRQ